MRGRYRSLGARTKTSEGVRQATGQPVLPVLAQREAGAAGGLFRRYTGPYDFVGDLAETAALIWPASSTNDGNGAAPGLAAAVAALNEAHRDSAAKLVEAWLNVMDATERWALLKLITGALRVGVSARLARMALAAYGRVETGQIEEVWPVSCRCARGCIRRSFHR